MKKVLIISYYWPPAGGPGVQRWLKFAKYLPCFGVQPVMYVPKNPHYPLQDASLVTEVPDGVRVVKKPILEPYSLSRIVSKNKTQEISSGIIPTQEKQGLLQKAMLFIRGNVFIPDARKFWVNPSVNFLKEFLQKEDINTIITTGPPHSLHLIGMKLQKAINVNWIADFRDPWTSIGYHEKMKLLEVSRKKHQRLEKQVLLKADRIIVTSNVTKKEFQERTDVPIKVITNGYDIDEVPVVSSDKDFTISHIGSLLSGRNPQQLWQAMGELVREDVGFAQHFKLKLVGVVGSEVMSSIEEQGLAPYLQIEGYISHKEALLMQRKSQVLLLIEIDHEQTRAIIPGKLFEYMVSGRPILAVGPADSDPEKIIRKTNTGSYFKYREKDEMKMYLRNCYKAYREGRLKNNAIGLQQYSRKNLTKELVKVIDTL